MQSLIILGGGCLGIVVGWLVVYFLEQFPAFDAKSLGSVVFIIAGGAVTTFLGTFSTVDASGKVYAYGGWAPVRRGLD
jgi:hypothetical protein